MAEAAKQKAAADKPPAPACATCGEDLGKDWRGPIVHCVGAPNVFRVVNRSKHHGHRFWRCPRCKRILGCDVCAGNNPNSIICKPCETTADGDVMYGSGREQIQVLLPRRRPSNFKSGIERSQPSESRS